MIITRCDSSSRCHGVLEEEEKEKDEEYGPDGEEGPDEEQRPLPPTYAPSFVAAPRMTSME